MSLLIELQSQFDSLNVRASPQVLQKCVELCTLYNIDCEDFMDQWLAYTASNLNGAPPTLDALDRMERKELKKQLKSAVTTTPRTYRKSEETTPSRTPVRQNLQQEMNLESPVATVDRVEPLQDSVSHNVPSKNFANRSDAGTVVQSFGECSVNSFKERSDSLSVKIQNEIPGSMKYMYEKFLSKRAAFDAMSKTVISTILKQKELELTQERLKQYSGEMTICGRICSELHEKLDQGTIQLEGLIDLYKGHRIKISTSKMDKVRLFSGQSVVVVGNNMKDYFTAKDIFTGVAIPPAPEPANFTESIQIVVAAGPFTLQENLLYEPLDHLLTHVNESKPNLLILMGPFMDSGHPHFDNLSETFDSFFESMVDGIMQRLKGTGVRVALVPSHKEVHHYPVFPTVPFKLKRRYENLYLAPNPFILDVNGVIIGGSTADILFHFGKRETCKGSFEDRVGHLVSHLFTQRSFYPLHPPESDTGVDYQLMQKCGMIHASPHIMILPSNFRHFVRSGVDSVAENCVIVNPERLTKGSGGGTFAKLEVRGAPQTLNLHKRISCVIQRI